MLMLLLLLSEWVDTADESVTDGRWEVAVVNDEYTDAVSSRPYYTVTDRDHQLRSDSSSDPVELTCDAPSKASNWSIS